MMDYVKISTEIVECLELLTTEEIGELFAALLAYHFKGEEPHLQGNGRYVFPVAKSLTSIGHEGVKGENHWNWKGGKTPKNQKQRASAKYKEWRTAVFARDDYTCQWCGKRGGALNAHHISPWATDESKRFDVSNGVTLCKECHRKEHRGGRHD